MDNKAKDSLPNLAVASELARSLALQTMVGFDAIQAQMELQLKQATNAIEAIIRPHITKIDFPVLDLKPLLSSFDQSFEKLFASFKKLNPILAQASVIMTENGWWIVRFFSIDFYRELIKAKDSITPEALTNYITRQANLRRCEQLENIVESWKVDAFQRRKENFSQALWVHRRKKYCVTVPALILHIEGIIREFVANDDGFTAWRFESVLNSFKRKFAKIEAAPPRKEIEFNEVNALVNYHNLKTLEKLYSIYDPGSHIDPDDLNRHAVSHGLWLHYSTVEISTKLFLLLDMLHSMLHQLTRNRAE
ncbi:MAG: hypothetical protein WAM82_21200 [Thermoanaerobaculia bacterium]